MNNQSFNPIVTDIKIYGTYRDVADRARTTIGLGKGNKMVSQHYMKKLYIAEHSPIRIRNFIIRVENVPYWLSTHFVRHHVGSQPFVSTQREDRNINIINRDLELQGNLVTLELFLNTQAVINISRKRLCKNAHPKATILWNRVLEKIKEIDKPLVDVCVRECIYRGFCPELKSCGFVNSDSYKGMVDEYRKGINQNGDDYARK